MSYIILLDMRYKFVDNVFFKHKYLKLTKSFAHSLWIYHILKNAILILVIYV